MPLYRRLPKLRGIAGGDPKITERHADVGLLPGMPAGKKKFVTVNLSTLSEEFEEGMVVDLNTLKERGIINATGRERNLPLKVDTSNDGCSK